MTRPELAQYVGEGEGKGRQYKHPTRLNELGKPLTAPSVTTVLKLENKDNLIQWAVNLAVEECVKNWSQLGQMSEERATKSFKYRWRNVRDERAFVGTGIHDTIESEHTGSWDFPELDTEQKLIMVEWRKFNNEWIVEPILSEFTLWNTKYNYAGTADALWRLTNRITGETFVTLLDIKTSRNTWDGHRMQVSALKYCDIRMSKQPDGTWTEEKPLEFDKLTLLHLRAPEYNEYGYVTKPGLHDLIVVDDSELWYEEFLGYRAVLKAQQDRKEIESKRKTANAGF